MTTLEAVNRILRAIGEVPVSTLDTGGTSEAAEAETFLGDSRAKILKRGWSFNTDLRIELAFPTVALGFTGSSGTFAYGETVTQSGSGATGTFCYIEGSTMYLVGVSGTFVALGLLTGGTSGATRTTSSYTAQTSGKIVKPSTWLSVQPAYNEAIGFTDRDGFLYDPWESTAVFTASVVARIISDASFTNLRQSMAEYVVADAAVEFQRFKKRGGVDEAVLQATLLEAKRDAESEDGILQQSNVLDTPGAIAIRGGRRGGRPWAARDENYA